MNNVKVIDNVILWAFVLVIVIVCLKDHLENYIKKVLVIFKRLLMRIKVFVKIFGNVKGVENVKVVNV